MAWLYSIADGNWTAAATWGVCATGTMDSEVGSDTVTTAYSGTRSSTFTPGAVTVSHLACKLANRTGTTGTFSISLRNATIGADDFVTGTECTINCSDLPAAVTADANGGWVVFKLSSPVLLLAATLYNVQVKTSSATQVVVFTNGTTDNVSRLIVTTTTQAPVAGDDMVVGREWTGAGASNARAVTMDNTASTDFGSATTAVGTPALAISDGGTLTWGVAASTAYLLKISGNVVVYMGGTHNQGTSGTPTPSGSSTELRFDCGTNVDFGLTVRNLGTDNFYGTKGVTAAYTKLTANAAAAATVLTVISTTGWEVSDELAIATTTRTATECETKTILTVDSATQVTLTAGLTNAHSGTNDANGDIRAEVASITRNARRNGTSATLQGYIDIKATATVNWSKCQCKWMGSGTGNKRGVQTATTTGTFTMTLSVLREFVVTSSLFYVSGISGGSGISITKNVMYSIDYVPFHTGDGGSNAMVCDDNICILSVGSTGINAFHIQTTLTGSFKRNISVGQRAASATSAQFGFISGSDTIHPDGVIADLEGHGGAGSGIIFNQTTALVINIGGTNRFYRNSSYGINSNGTGGHVSVTAANMFGNTTAGLLLQDGFLLLPSATFNAGTTLTQPIGIAVGAAGAGIVKLRLSSLGLTNAHATADISTTNANTTQVIGHDVTLGSTNKVVLALPRPIGENYPAITILKYGGVAGDHRVWKYGGRLTGTQPIHTFETDTTIFSTASPSLRMYPGYAARKLRSNIFRVAVASGATLTPSVKVRSSLVSAGDSATYNGAYARLILLENQAAGITADTVLDTATAANEGAFETLTGTTASVTADAILEFVVDCDGTVGWINIDDFSCVGIDPGGMKNWAGLLAGPGVWGVPAVGPVGSAKIIQNIGTY